MGHLMNHIYQIRQENLDKLCDRILTEVAIIISNMLTKMLQEFYVRFGYCLNKKTIYLCLSNAFGNSVDIILQFCISKKCGVVTSLQLVEIKFGSYKIWRAQTELFFLI